MTVLNGSTSELLSELELDARKPRKVQVRRQTGQTVDERLAEAQVAKAVEAAVLGERTANEITLAVKMAEAQTALDTAVENSRAAGVVEGRREADLEYDDSFDDEMNSRICDRDAALPWSVGVIVAGEQHRILQALADYLDGFDQPGLNAEGFARRLGMPYYPEYTTAPDPITRHNCEAPPGTKAEGNTLAQDNFSPFWIYYVKQLDQG